MSQQMCKQICPLWEQLPDQSVSQSSQSLDYKLTLYEGCDGVVFILPRMHLWYKSQLQ